MPKAELAEVDVAEEDEPDHRTAPMYLRHMLSHTQWHHIPQNRSVTTYQDMSDALTYNRSHGESNTNSLKMTKSVSFAKVESILGGE